MSQHTEQPAYIALSSITPTIIEPAPNQLLVEAVFFKTPVQVELPNGEKIIKEQDQAQDIFKIINHGVNVPETSHTHVITKSICADMCKVGNNVLLFIDKELVLAYVTATEEV